MSTDEKTCVALQTGNIRSPKGRLSYAYLLKPNPKSKDKNGNVGTKYTTSLLIPPGCDLKLLKDAATECAREKWGEKAKTMNLKSPFLDAAEKMGEEWKGYTLLRLSTPTKPGILNAKGDTVTEPQDVYSGRWAFISMRPFWYDTDGNRGVAFGLGNVQVLDHDEPIGGRPRAESEFTPVEGVDGSDAGNVFAD